VYYVVLWRWRTCQTPARESCECRWSGRSVFAA